ncbi:MAG TPA: ankyrin repeat domain-containing protein, partial [Lacipirellulaceae bacterium]|nr:ankyrin repeat domain-containing protein [Lacipirellulaceae bacterium]
TLLIVVSTVAILLAIIFALQPDRKPKLLIDAAYRGDLKSVKDLLAKGAPVDFHDGSSGTPLMYAVGHMDMIKALVEAGANINERSRLGRTPLMWAANDGHIDVIRYLLKKGANPALLDDNGESAAGLAEKNGFKAIAATLRSFNAPPKSGKQP